MPLSEYYVTPWYDTLPKERVWFKIPLKEYARGELLKVARERGITLEDIYKSFAIPGEDVTK